MCFWRIEVGLLVPAANATHLKVTRRPGTEGREGRKGVGAEGAAARAVVTGPL